MPGVDEPLPPCLALVRRSRREHAADQLLVVLRQLVVVAEDLAVLAGQ